MEGFYDMKNYLKLFTTPLSIFLFASGQSVANQLKEEILERNFPYPYSQIVRFIPCSHGSIEIIPLNNQFEEFIIIVRELDEKCFGEVNRDLANRMFENVDNEKQENSLEPSSYVFDLEFESKDAEQVKFPYEISSVISPIQMMCGESCTYATEQLIKIGKNYYFLSYPSDFGIHAKMITDNLMLFEIQMSTHKRNIVFDMAVGQLEHLPNGDLEFSENSLIVRGQKSYLKDFGGSFWYDSKRNFKGEITEFLDVSGGACIDRRMFHEELENKLIAAGKTELCVSR